MVYKVVSNDFDHLSQSHLQPKSKNLGLQAAPGSSPRDGEDIIPQRESDHVGIQTRVGINLSKEVQRRLFLLFTKYVHQIKKKVKKLV